MKLLTDIKTPSIIILNGRHLSFVSMHKYCQYIVAMLTDIMVECLDIMQQVKVAYARGNGLIIKGFGSVVKLSKLKVFIISGFCELLCSAYGYDMVYRIQGS